MSDYNDPLKVEKRKARELRKNLRDLTACVAATINALDVEMKKPSSNERGSRIAKITNALEMQNQMAIRYGLKK